jgi:hypothetical protein
VCYDEKSVAQDRKREGKMLESLNKLVKWLLAAVEWCVRYLLFNVVMVIFVFWSYTLTDPFTEWANNVWWKILLLFVIWLVIVLSFMWLAVKLFWGKRFLKK